MHRKGGDLNRDRQVARPGGWLDWVAKTLSTECLQVIHRPPPWQELCEPPNFTVHIRGQGESKR